MPVLQTLAMRVQAGFLLGTTLEEHPAMAPVMVREIERFLFRPGIAPRARYYAVVFLNQLQLSHDEARGEPCPALVQCAAQPTAPCCCLPEPAAAVPR